MQVTPVLMHEGKPHCRYSNANCDWGTQCRQCIRHVLELAQTIARSRLVVRRRPIIFLRTLEYFHQCLQRKTWEAREGRNESISRHTVWTRGALHTIVRRPLFGASKHNH